MTTAFGSSSSSSVWLDNSLFQSPPGTSVVVPGQTGSMSLTQPGLTMAGVGAASFPPPQPMAGIAVASAMYHHQQHTYPQVSSSTWIFNTGMTSGCVIFQLLLKH